MYAMYDDGNIDAMGLQTVRKSANGAGKQKSTTSLKTRRTHTNELNTSPVSVSTITTILGVPQNARKREKSRLSAVSRIPQVNTSTVK